MRVKIVKQGLVLRKRRRGKCTPASGCDKKPQKKGSFTELARSWLGLCGVCSKKLVVLKCKTAYGSVVFVLIIYRTVFRV